ncbi:uncharacterized protein B0I36DRAFT_396422 [Microdochium trichocladiopsis]|uniref:Uncharacterized protein n=1 Tax=Microdochium trichocladiopsis TaxID=1682393 RepID=A0A9P8XT42_9PEZI|nr:uncharacterized protein B0I36DRAFT_396422 [Microdochium trichocladiopsis]KAH7016277.1 hypothetical protein B0I36DRAFT_396422 [Microdochium trichocladiopsis]
MPRPHAPDHCMMLVKPEEDDVHEVETTPDIFKVRPTKLGVAVLRGLDPSRYPVEDNTIIFLGLARYIGAQGGIHNPTGLVFSIPHRYVLLDTSYACSLKDVFSWRVVLVPADAIHAHLREKVPDVLATLAAADWQFRSRRPRPGAEGGTPAPDEDLELHRRYDIYQQLEPAPCQSGVRRQSIIRPECGASLAA